MSRVEVLRVVRQEGIVQTVTILSGGVFQLTFGRVNGQVKKIGVSRWDKRISDGVRVPDYLFWPALKTARAIFAASP